MQKRPQFAALELDTLKENVASLLTEAIFSGKIKPGERLNESQLARELQVSRAPIREALLRLQEQGLVVNNPRRGMFVVQLEDEDIQKINSIRVILEAEALRLCRANLTPEREIRLLQLLERLERSENSPPNIRARLDFDFHRALWGMTGNDYLERTLSSLTAPLFAHSVLRLMKKQKVRLILLSHRPLIAFVQGKLKAPAEQIVAEHLRVPWAEPERFSSLVGKAKHAADGR